MNTQKKRNTQKKEKPKGERTSVPRPLSWNIYVKKQCRHTNRAGYIWCGFKSRRGKNKNLTALKSNSNTVWFNFQTYIIYLYIHFVYSLMLVIRSSRTEEIKYKTFD